MPVITLPTPGGNADTWAPLLNTAITTVNNAVDANTAAIATKQNTLVAGTNITIVGNTISATGGGGGGSVSSVNGQTGAVDLDAADVGALPSTYTPAWGDISSKPATFAPTIGSTGSTAVAGNDARLSDQRVPTDGSVTSAKIADGAIVDADVNASAGIAQSKIANLTSDLAGKQSLVEKAIAGAGIDPTGSADSTSAVQTLITSANAGDTLVIPTGAVIRLTSGITISDRILLKGTGELRFTAGITNSSAITVTADGVSLRDFTITNPNELSSQTGGKNIAIEVQANNFTIDNVTISKFQNGIVQAPTGEFEGMVVTNNRIVDVLGAGDGPGPGSHGEDRGDGITIWGARGTVTGNIVTAKAGTDARIGIHAEDLPGLPITPGNYEASMVTIANNVVSGKFRRGISTEEMRFTTITGNTVADSTWWAISIIEGAGGTITGNTVKWSRTSGDTQGADWNVRRGGIVAYKSPKSISITGNTIDVQATGNADAAIMLYSFSGAGAEKATITGNVVSVESGGVCGDGIWLDIASRPIVTGNNVQFTGGSGKGGIVSSYSNAPLISDNAVRGPGAGTSGYGVYMLGNYPATIHSNMIEDIEVGIALINVGSTYGVSVKDNQFANNAIGMDFFGTTAPVYEVGNRIITGVSTPRSNFGGSVISIPDQKLVAGTNVTLTPGTGTLTIAATGGGGSGDVAGPASATNNNIAVFDGTTGKLIKDGGATVAALANIGVPTFISVEASPPSYPSGPAIWHVLNPAGTAIIDTRVQFS